MPDRFVLDASALLCLLNGEDGAGRVHGMLDDAIISSVNYSEVVAKIIERGGSLEVVQAILDPLYLRTIDFDVAQAVRAGAMRASTRSFGLSLGDRACLALATISGLIAVTGDRAWADLPLDIEVEIIR